MPPAAPSVERCEHLLDELAHFVTAGGAAPLLAPPVIPGPGSFPERWSATRGGVLALLRRLAWHAGNHRTVSLEDARQGAPPTERVPGTRVGLLSLDASALRFRCEFLGKDDVVGALANELGVAHAALHRRESAEPYRVAERDLIEIDAERDHERGSIATVYLGLGVLGANAAFQQYANAGRFNGAYVPHEYDVIQSGYLEMSAFAFLLAVQAVLRGAPEVPAGLEGPQRDETRAWIAALRPCGDELRTRLGITAAALASAITERPSPVMFADVDLREEVSTRRRAGFRLRTNRGGLGLVAGGVIGGVFSFALSLRTVSPWIMLGTMGAGHLAGRRVRAFRCTACASLVPAGAPACPDCKAPLARDIDTLADRLDAEDEA